MDIDGKISASLLRRTAIMLGIVVGLGICPSFAQDKEPQKEKVRKFRIYGGGGLNFYFNNLVTAKQYVNPWNYSFAGRFMWEPGHLVSIGFETGYYRLYTVKLSGVNTVHIINSAIPLQLVVSMRFPDHFYGQFAMGQSVLLNNVNSPAYGDFKATTFSLGDFSGTLGYKWRAKNRMSLGSEIKAYYSSNANDTNLALLLMFGYSL